MMVWFGMHHAAVPQLPCSICEQKHMQSLRLQAGQKFRQAHGQLERSRTAGYLSASCCCHACPEYQSAF